MTYKLYKKTAVIISILFLFCGVLFITSICQAQDSVVSKVGQSCLDSGNCELSDFTRIAIQVAQIILGISGSAALLAFIVGGVMFLTSAGNKTWIDRGKATITGAVIGLAIVFASWAIIGFIITKFVPGSENKWFQAGWFSGQQ